MTSQSASITPAGRLPEIIQGGMGAGVSDWRLARAVSTRGGLGVISGTALDTMMIRRLQLGDAEGHIRRALSHFPWPAMAGRVLDAFYVPGGKPAGAPFRLVPMPTLPLAAASVERIIVANFVEVYLAKEGHDGPVGVNYLSKIQLPNLPSLLGAMLAGVDVIIMGGGIPLQVPGVLDTLARGEAADMAIALDGGGPSDTLPQHLDPQALGGTLPALRRPTFLAIVSSATLAKTLLRRATGQVDGFVVENHTAGGHSAPPRRGGGTQVGGAPTYGAADDIDVASIAGLGRPFWLAGGYASPGALREARAQGARGVQVGSIFAYCAESAITTEIKREVIARYRRGALEVVTDHRASPTGYPFKVIDLGGQDRERLCDLGYLRQPYRTPSGGIDYRCPAEPAEAYLRKGGQPEEMEGRRCLCNGLAATVGLAQVRGESCEPPIVTSGEDLSFLGDLLGPTRTEYTAAEALAYLRG